MDHRSLILALGLLLATCAHAEESDHPSGPKRKEGSNQFSLGVHASSVYAYPVIEYQRLIINHLAVGALAFYTESTMGDTAKRMKGGAATLNFYAFDGFRGLWLRAGYGVYYFETRNGGDRDNFKRNGFLTTLGARGKWEGGFNIGLSAGAILIQRFSSNVVDFSSNGTIPIVTFELGINF